MKQPTNKPTDPIAEARDVLERLKDLVEKSPLIDPEEF